MNRRRYNLLLWCLSGLLLALSVAVVGYGLAAPMPTPPTAAPDIDDQASATPPGESFPPAEAFAAIWEKPVRGRASIEEAPTITNEVQVEGESVPVQLLGTAREGDGGYAVFLDESNVVQVRRIGEEIAGAVVISVTADRVELERAGRRVTLLLPVTDTSGGEGG